MEAEEDIEEKIKAQTNLVIIIWGQNPGPPGGFPPMQGGGPGEGFPPRPNFKPHGPEEELLIPQGDKKENEIITNSDQRSTASMQDPNKADINAEFLKIIKASKTKIIQIENRFEKIIDLEYPYYIYYEIYNKNYSILKEIIEIEENLVIIKFFQEENEDKNLIKEISKIDYKGKHHPFIIFFSSLTREYYRNYIDDNNINFDSLNIITYNSKYNFTNLYNILEDIEKYYHERPNNTNYHSFGINLCVLGNPGKGKSSFINCIAQKKIALEGNNINKDTTKNFIKYTIEKKINDNEYGVINIFDCPGFGIDGKEKNKIKKSIKEKFKYFNERHDYIHGFLYFIYKDKTDRVLQKAEIKLLEEIYELLINENKDSIILFIINNHIEDEYSDNPFKNRLILKLKEEFNNKFKNDDDIIYVNLKKNIRGIDKVFNRLYYYFEKHKIPILNKNPKETDIEFEKRQNELIRNSMFFRYIEKEEDIVSKITENCQSIINDYANRTSAYGKLLQKDEIINKRKEMLNKIEQTLISSVYIESQELKNNEIYKKFWKNIPLLGPWLEGRFMAEESPRVTKDIANQFINQHIAIQEKTSRNHFCLILAKQYNNSIDSLKKISESFLSNSIEIKSEVKNNEFIIKFTTNFKDPKIVSHQVYTEDNKYIFKIDVKFPSLNDAIIAQLDHIKNITEFKLDKDMRDRVVKENENNKCHVSIYYKLRILNKIED